MSVEKYLKKGNRTKHIALLDPDEQNPNEAGNIARDIELGGSDAIMVGGSLGGDSKLIENTVNQIKKKSNLPVILFPHDHTGLTSNADAVFYMSLLNSRNPMYISGFQARGAPLVNKFDIEVMPMAYLIVEPGGTVGYVGDAKLIPRDKPEVAVAYSLGGQYMGMDFVYLEAGSGSKEPVKEEMVASVDKYIDSNTSLIVGGGIKTPEKVSSLSKAGANIIVTGTILETFDDIENTISKITDVLK